LKKVFSNWKYSTWSKWTTRITRSRHNFGQFFRVSGYRLQLRLQAIVQVPEKKRGASQIRKQQYVHMARRAGERHVLRSRPHQMRY